MGSEPVALVEISLDFAEIPHRQDENFSYEHVQVGQLRKAG